LGCTRSPSVGRRPQRIIYRPSLYSRSNLAGRFSGTQKPRDQSSPAAADDRNAGSQRADPEPGSTRRRRTEPQTARIVQPQLRGERCGILQAGQSRTRCRAYRRARTGDHSARHDDRMRRQPHLDARGFRRRRIRNRHVGSRNGIRFAVHPAAEAQNNAHYRERQARQRGDGQRHRPVHHLEDIGVGRNGTLSSSPAKRSATCRWKSG